MPEFWKNYKPPPFSNKSELFSVVEGESTVLLVLGFNSRMPSILSLQPSKQSGLKVQTTEPRLNIFECLVMSWIQVYNYTTFSFGAIFILWMHWESLHSSWPLTLRVDESNPEVMVVSGTSSTILIDTGSSAYFCAGVRFISLLSSDVNQLIGCLIHETSLEIPWYILSCFYVVQDC